MGPYGPCFGSRFRLSAAHLKALTGRKDEARAGASAAACLIAGNRTCQKSTATLEVGRQDATNVWRHYTHCSYSAPAPPALPCRSGGPCCSCLGSGHDFGLFGFDAGTESQTALGGGAAAAAKVDAALGALAAAPGAATGTCNRRQFNPSMP